MKILVIDYPGAALDWCMQCQNAGHEVRLWIGPTKEKTRSEIGDGIVKRVADFRAFMGWADMIFMTDNAYCMDMIEPFHKKGYPIFGANLAGGKLELDRQHGQDAFKKAGFAVLGGHEFDDYDAAIKFVKQDPSKVWVSKPDGDVDKALSFVSKDAASMEYMLTRWKKNNPGTRGFILQEFCPGLGEFAVGGWFGKAGWLKGWCENFEFKKLLPGDKGPNTGEMGTVLRYVEKSKMADELLLPLTDLLKKIKYRGYVDVASIIDLEGTPRPLEFTTRPGWPCFIIQSALHRGDPAQWMADALEGRDTLEFVDEIAAGVVVATGDFPFGHLTRKEVSGYPLSAPEEEITDGIHLCEVKRENAPHMEDGEVSYDQTYVTAGDYVAVCTGTDYTIAQAAKRAYRSVKKLDLVSSQTLRDDIGERLKKQLPDIQEFGYAEGWAYD